jgi:adenylate kinase
MQANGSRARKGLLIAFMGLPGSGKTTTARELANLLGVDAYLEPEEKNWPPAVLDRHRVGAFTALTWFRSMRVPLLMSAADDRRSGKIAVVDSYYDKLIAGYIAHPRMGWLIDTNDPYFEVAKQMAILDQKVLPDVDVLVFLRVNKLAWRRLLSTRNRDMDQEPEFLRSFPSQSDFLIASRSFVETSGAELIVHDQHFGSAYDTAIALRGKLQEAGLLGDQG